MRKAQDQKRKTEKEDRLKSVGRAGAPQGAGGRAEAGLYKGVGQSGARPGEEAGVGEKTATSVDGPGGRGQGVAWGSYAWVSSSLASHCPFSPNTHDHLIPLASEQEGDLDAVPALVDLAPPSPFRVAGRRTGGLGKGGR